MFKQLILSTDDDYRATILRIGLGIAILPHGLQKLVGWFGGGGVGGTVNFFSATWGIPAAVTLLVILAESFGALGLIFGFLSRIAAAGIAFVMLGAVALVHLPNGFFMNWSGGQAGEGFEYHILAVAISIVVIIKGGGALSVDRQLARAA
jgi:putative oxidoreductase